MPVMMGVTQDPGTNQVDGQADDRDHDSFLVGNGLGRQQALDRPDHHECGHAQQKHSTGKTAQHLDLPGAKGKSGVAGVPTGRGVGHGGQPNGHCVGAHVPPVGQQGHGVEPPPRQDFGHHHGGRDPHHPPRAALGGLVADVKDVVVDPVGEGLRKGGL